MVKAWIENDLLQSKVSLFRAGRRSGRVASTLFFLYTTIGQSRATNYITRDTHTLQEQAKTKIISLIQSL